MHCYFIIKTKAVKIAKTWYKKRYVQKQKIYCNFINNWSGKTSHMFLLNVTYQNKVKKKP